VCHSEEIAKILRKSLSEPTVHVNKAGKTPSTKAENKSKKISCKFCSYCTSIHWTKGMGKVVQAEPFCQEMQESRSV